MLLPSTMFLCSSFFFDIRLTISYATAAAAQHIVLDCVDLLLSP